MNRKPYLSFYTGHILTEWMPAKGLCDSLPWSNRIKLFQPTWDEFNHCNPESCYWGYDGNFHLHTGEDILDFEYKFTPFRQTIVLFMAAMNNEL